MGTEEIFQDGWKFLILPIDADLMQAEALSDTFEPVDIPHDWLIDNTERFSAEIAESGWYCKTFSVCRKPPEETWILRFDGVYMDSAVYLNGSRICRWRNGYTCFMADLTEHLKEGENHLFVSAKYETPCSRWYSGAGIYRSVRLLKLPQNHLIPDGIYITLKQEKNGFAVTIQTEALLSGEVTLYHTIREKDSLTCLAASSGVSAAGTAGSEVQTIKESLCVESPKLWDTKHPFLYELITEIRQGEEVVDRQVNRLGFRTIAFDPQQGFFLNGVRTKLNGVCEHHDLGCLGAAFNKTAMRRKLDKLRKMGANAVRISHNMPAKEVIELTDEMGILVVSELYDMWERPKNRKDFARFFLEAYEQDTASWIRRDRNAPSVIMWSIGNEIYDTHAGERGQELTRLLRDEVLKHDPGKNAYVTLASNYMPWENAGKCADLVKIAGYNYSEAYYREHHCLHPDWVIYGSETASVVQSRGVYHFPAKQQILTDDDLQCSSLGNSITSWGARSIDDCITAERDCSFSCGQFIWTGFDYIGEPTPYHTKNSYFGQLDTAGFEKDSYYLYQSAWTDYHTDPMVHLYPWWDFNEGQLIDVGICSNAPLVELFVNDVSQGRKRIRHETDKTLTALWQIPYERGSIRAEAFDEAGRNIATHRRHSFGDAAQIVLTADKTTMDADGRDLIFVTIETLDEYGYLVENANNRVEVNVTGAGRLVGLDNGDSTDYDQYSSTVRRLFSGKLLAVVGAALTEGEIMIEAASLGLRAAKLVCHAKGVFKNEGISAVKENRYRERKTGVSEGADIPVRKIEIISKCGNELNAQNRKLELVAVLHPGEAVYDEVEWSVTDDAGIPSHIAALTGKGKTAVLTAEGDGCCRVRCMVKNGTGHISLISQMEFTITGLGQRYRNPYEFLSGGLYSFSKGVVGNGNERGFATARDGETQVGFENLDFGEYGSDRVTIPVFALTEEPYPIEIWEGKPGEEGSERLAEVIYQKPSIWNVYQEETYRLKRRIKGIASICFVLRQKVHIKGFTFLKPVKGMECLYGAEADRIYGDSYCREGRFVREIGNNVSLEFKELDFGTQGVKSITIYGDSPIACNSVHLCISGEQGDSRQLIEFTRTEGMEERKFKLDPITGVNTITFLFLPGSRFDFGWFYME